MFHQRAAKLRVLSALALAIPAFAQFDTATVLGTVRDPSGAAIAGSKVTLQNVDTGITQQAVTDASGNYTFSM